MILLTDKVLSLRYLGTSSSGYANSLTLYQNKNCLAFKTLCSRA